MSPSSLSQGYTGITVAIDQSHDAHAKSFVDIVDHCCYAWNTLIEQPWKIMSIARRDWAAAGHSI